MVRSDTFVMIDKFLRRHSPDSELPFGGVQIILFGDIFQLPPVLRQEEKEFFFSQYPSPFFFNTGAYKRANFSIVCLTKVYRQADEDYIGLLENIRRGRTTEEDLIHLNKRSLSLFPHFDSEEQIMTLTAYNQTAIKMNSFALKNLPGKEYSYLAEISGDMRLKQLPVPYELTLRVGARVLLTKNDKEGRWVNGTSGVISQLSDQSIFVDIQGQTHEIQKNEWESVRHTFDDKKGIWKKKKIGGYKQYPLILAWAITIHRSQGQTLDACVIDLGRGAFAEGQLYVGLSRCRRLSTLYLKRPLSFQDISINKQVQKFYQEEIVSQVTTC